MASFENLSDTASATANRLKAGSHDATARKPVRWGMQRIAA